MLRGLPAAAIADLILAGLPSDIANSVAEELAALLNKLVANQTISADVATIIQRAASG